MNRPLAIAAGAVLFALPFLQYGSGDHHGGLPHMDHGPRHGGRLLMLGDRHLEVVENDGMLEVFVSDAERRPLRARSATVAFDDGERLELAWSGYRLVAPAPPLWSEADYDIRLDGEPPLTVRLPRGGVAMPPHDRVAR